MRFGLVLISLFLFTQRGVSNIKYLKSVSSSFELNVRSIENNFLNQKSLVFDTISLHETTQTENDFFIEALKDTTQSESILEIKKVKFKRGKAILFTIFTGFLGGHRIYLGTHHRTPIIYSVTLGGLGILAVVDLINLITTKDISKFENKTQVIMWADE